MEFERLKRELVYKGAIIDMYKDYVRTPSGHVAEWDFIGHKGAAAVVPVTEDGKLLMVRQYRNAIDRYTIEIPAGGRDSLEEETLACASRELEEETGFRSDNLELLIQLKTAVAYCNEFIDVYVARDLIPSRQHLDEDEYYIADLIGMELYLEDGSRFGTLKDVMETGANDVYIVTTEEGKEVLIPAIHDCILDVDVEANRMEIHLLDGLLD